MHTIKLLAKRIWHTATGSKIQIGKFILKSNWAHDLPHILSQYPEYSQSLVRLARTIRKKYNNITIFDIGANIGDTAAMLLTDYPDYTVVCIEGDKQYFQLLSNNLGAPKNVFLHQVFLDDIGKSS